MLLLLLLAKGWAITRLELTHKPLVFTIWFIYGVVHVLLYVWNMVRHLYKVYYKFSVVMYFDWSICAVPD